MSVVNKAGIVCCSNGQALSYKEDIDGLIDILNGHGINIDLSDYLYSIDSVSSGTPIERAQALMKLYEDEEITDILDISGGDIANEVLPYLDYKKISDVNKRFWGYSDLTTVINAIYTMSGRESVLYQVKNLIWDKTGRQEEIFLTTKMYEFAYEFYQGSYMSGVVVGGNIRCLLKLAGTKYFPELKDKILFLEALSGGEAQLRTYLAQLNELGAFSKTRGILLGTFTEFEKTNSGKKIFDMIHQYTDAMLPIAKTNDIGHSNLSKALVIGKVYSLG